MYVIVSGRLAVHVRGTTVAELGERDVVGEMAALSPEPRSASVTALEDSLLLAIGHRELEYLLGTKAEVARAVIAVLCQRLRSSIAGPRTESAPAPVLENA